MNKLLLILILTFTFKSFCNADDIDDLQLEGMSIGDSALSFFSESHIKKNTWDYPNKKFKRVQNDNLSFFNTYDSIDFHYETKDLKYTIHSISGILFFNKNINDCYKKMDEVVSDLETSLSQIKFNKKSTFKHPSPKNKSGKSKVTDTFFKFKNGDTIRVSCYDFSKEHAVNQNHLSISLDTNEFNKWLTNKAFN